jgi:hypothetical protein
VIVERGAVATEIRRAGYDDDCFALDAGASLPNRDLLDSATATDVADHLPPPVDIPAGRAVMEGVLRPDRGDDRGTQRTRRRHGVGDRRR